MLLLHENQRADDLAALLDDVRAVVADHLVVVVEHRPRRRADPLDVVRVGAMHALGDRGRVCGGGGAGLEAFHARLMEWPDDWRSRLPGRPRNSNTFHRDPERRMMCPAASGNAAGREARARTLRKLSATRGAAVLRALPRNGGTRPMNHTSLAFAGCAGTARPSSRPPRSHLRRMPRPPRPRSSSRSTGSSKARRRPISSPSTTATTRPRASTSPSTPVPDP